MGKLTATAVKHAKPHEQPYKISDGHGLYLLVKTAGGKYWRYGYRVHGKQKDLALGVYPEVTLAEAREEHAKAHKLVSKGVDPAEQRKLEKLTKAQARANTFEAVGREWFARHMEPMSESHRVRTQRILEKDLYPRLGDRPIGEIEPPELLAVLRRVEKRTVDIAIRAKQAAGQIFRYAVATGRAQRDPTADLRGVGVLERRVKVHYPSVTNPKGLGELLAAIDSDRRSTPETLTALKMAVLTFQRPGLIAGMEWDHIDWERGLWDIPAEAMQKTAKAGEQQRPHNVPLSQQAISLLRDLHRFTGRRLYAFPSKSKGDGHVTTAAMGNALKRLGYAGKQTTHGFRATARTLLDEELGYRPDIIEHQSAHAVKDPNGRAYNRTTYLPQRTEMMQAWADYLDDRRNAATSDNVVTLSRGTSGVA